MIVEASQAVNGGGDYSQARRPVFFKSVSWKCAQREDETGRRDVKQRLEIVIHHVEHDPGGQGGEN
jgi:hypothetical protein